MKSKPSDIIIMKNGKSKLINGLMCGKTILINMTGFEPFNHISDLSDLLYINTISWNSIIDNRWGLKNEFNTIIFYTYYKYSESIKFIEAIEKVYKNEHCVFMFSEV